MTESLRERVARAMCYRATDHDVDAAIAIVLDEAIGALKAEAHRVYQAGANMSEHIREHADAVAWDMNYAANLILALKDPNP